MVLAYQVILSFYVFWPPNDPRGSWSDWVASWELFRSADRRLKLRRVKT